MSEILALLSQKLMELEQDNDEKKIFLKTKGHDESMKQQTVT